MALMAIHNFSYSQTSDKKNNMFIELWVSYTSQVVSGRTAIKPTMIVDLGVDKTVNTTEFTIGPSVNGDKENFGIKETNGTPKTFTNEVDMIRYFYSYGWEIMSTENITVSSVNYVRYIFTKASTTTTKP